MVPSVTMTWARPYLFSQRCLNVVMLGSVGSMPTGDGNLVANSFRAFAILVTFNLHTISRTVCEHVQSVRDLERASLKEDDLLIPQRSSKNRRLSGSFWLLTLSVQLYTSRQNFCHIRLERLQIFFYSKFFLSAHNLEISCSETRRRQSSIYYE